MHVVRIGLLVLTCLAIFGCKKTGETDVVATAPPIVANHETRAAAPALTDKRPVIVIFGDSLSEVGVDTNASYPDVLQRTLDAKGYQYRIVNQGISGDTTTGGVGRTQAAIELKPAMVLLELGGNDGLRGIPVASSKANLETMIEEFQKAGIRVVLAGMSLPPNYGAEYIRSFEKMYSDLAAKYHLTLIPFLLSDIALGLAKHPEWMGKDGIHPTPEGNKVVAATVLRTLEPLLKKP